MARLSLFLLLAAILNLGGCASLPDNSQRPYSSAVTDTDDTRLGRNFNAELARHPGQSGFLLLGNGLDAFVARAALMSVAERSIDLQYYLFHDDLVGNLITYLLLQAADRGVRIRVLLDDMDMSGRGWVLAALDAHPNIEIRLFNPFNRHLPRNLQFLTRFGTVTRRMHNKSFTVDNQAPVVGGRNIGDEYFDADMDLAFGDLDVLAVGPVVKEVSASFDDYWNHELAYPVSSLLKTERKLTDLEGLQVWADGFWQEQKDSAYLTALRDSPLARALRQNRVSLMWGEAEAVYDSPDKLTHGIDRNEFHLTPKLVPYVQSMQREFIVLSAYFVPGREGVAFLEALRKRGVRVRILTNSLATTDVPIVHAGYVRYRKALLRAGVELYETSSIRPQSDRSTVTGSSRASLHAKTYLFDREYAFIGSLNLDPRSDKENTEIGLLIHSPRLAARMGELFDEGIEAIAYRLRLNRDGDIEWVDLRGDREIVYRVEPNASFFTRFWVGLARLLPIESQL